MLMIGQRVLWVAGLLAVSCGSPDNQSTTLLLVPTTTASASSGGSDSSSESGTPKPDTTTGTTTAPDPSTSGSSGEGSSSGGGNPTAGEDADGLTMIYPPTSEPPIEMEYGSRHENGDRYNQNHAFINYEVTGYYYTSGTEKIEMKTDGPNHSGCDELPECMWAEPRIDIADGRASISSEYPHPDNHDDADCPSCETFGDNLEDRWIGYKVIAYTGSDGYRVYEQWLDPDGLDADDKPVNNWMLMMRETNTGQVMPHPDREIPVDYDRGLEAEIRMHGGHETEMMYGKIQEIIPPGGSSS
jgi:hypothetical protein